MENKIIKKEFYFKSSNHISNIYSVIWIDENLKEYKGIIQIVHGMAEHIIRYEDFAKFLASNGFIVCGNDHIGHGKSVNHKSEFGYFGEGEFNYLKLVKDIKKLNNIVSNKYNNLSTILIGHSMGSFLARDYACRYPKNIKCSIFIGTSGKNKLIDIGRKLCSIKIKKGIGNKNSKIMDKIAFGNYNTKFRNNKTNFDWLSSDEKVVKDFINDENCAFIFTYAGFYDLFTALKMVSSNSWYRKFNKKMPVLLTSGNMDPVGNYGKGVKEVYKKLKKNNANVEIKLYENMRHEILNEKNKINVYNDILNWINQKI